MQPSTLPSDVLQTLQSRLQAMTEAMLRGDKLGVAHCYSDNALLTDLHEFRAEGRAAIDDHWTHLPTYKTWQLLILETGGDTETPYQRLHSIARLDFKGKEYTDEGYCFVVWKKQPDGDYRIYVDVYRPLNTTSRGSDS